MKLGCWNGSSIATAPARHNRDLPAARRRRLVDRAPGFIVTYFKKESEHKESITHSDCDQLESATSSCIALENFCSLTFHEYALPLQAVEQAHESQGNRREWKRFHASDPPD